MSFTILYLIFFFKIGKKLNFLEKILIFVSCSIKLITQIWNILKFA
jgi:hypothetical protein